MSGFVPLQSRAWKFLGQTFGTRISKEELVSLGQVVAHELDIELVREYKRRKDTMIKWFDEHLDEVREFMEHRVRIVDHDDGKGKA